MNGHIVGGRYAIGYDSADETGDVGAVPDSAPFVLPYIDGRFAWSAAARARFARTPTATITVAGDPDAVVFDYEAGACTAAEIAYALHRRRRKRLPSVIYVSSAQWGALLGQLMAAGLSQAPSYWWIASWAGPPGTLAIPAEAPLAMPTYGKRYTAVGHQFWAGDSFGPRCFDLSVIDLARWPLYYIGRRGYFAPGA